MSSDADIQRMGRLSSQEAASRLARDGPNEIERSRRRTLGQRMLDMLRQPMFALLVVAALLYTVLGDFSEGVTLGVFVLAVLALTLIQEGKSEASMEALQQLSQTHALVERDGSVIKIPSRELVQGDWLHLSEGDRVSADAALIHADNLQIDESLLTGESVPVSKSAVGTAPTEETHNLSQTRVFGGTFVVRGQAIACVTATGPRSEVGKIGGIMNRLVAEVTPLQRQTAQLVKVLAIIALALCSVMIVTLGLQTGHWLLACLSGIALAMAILPEEYPVVLTVFPALGARRLAQQGVLTRRINAIETLGAITVLCTDKTGTLTENRMGVVALATGQAESPQHLSLATIDGKTQTPLAQLPEDFHRLVEHAILASAPQPFDPMEVAFHQLGQDHLQQTEHLHRDWQLVKTYALSPQLRAMSHVWRASEGAGHVISAKGAPEAVMSLCHMPAHQQQQWAQAVDQMAANGLRVLAVAQGRFDGTDWPSSEHDFDFEWLGLIGLADPIRPEIAQAMADCHSAGIRVIMITGDYPTTAQVIARQAGVPAGATLVGDELEQLDDAALSERLKDVSVCARISPQQKLRIVQALKRNGEIVGMTGDGVNDAPALRAAHVGIAMGERGTDVAREASELVLTNDNFASIVRAIRLGRRIFANLQKSMSYIFAVHIPIAALAMLPMLLAMPPLLLPLHIALLELIIDPACSLAFENEAEDPTVMQQPPRDTNAPLFGWRALTQALGQGVIAAACVGLSYGVSVMGATHEFAQARSRSMVMVTLVVAHCVLIFSNRSTLGQSRLGLPPHNAVANTVTILALSLVALGVYVPWLAEQLKFHSLAPHDLGLAVLCGLLTLVGVLIWRRMYGVFTVQK